MQLSRRKIGKEKNMVGNYNALSISYSHNCGGRKSIVPSKYSETPTSLNGFE